MKRAATVYLACLAVCLGAPDLHAALLAVLITTALTSGLVFLALLLRTTTPDSPAADTLGAERTLP